MSIISGARIIQEIMSKQITATHFREENVGPNSIDVHLGGSKIFRLRNWVGFDEKKNQPIVEYDELDWDEKGEIIVAPNCLYIMSTLESITSKKYVPMIEGCSSLGRMGITIHETAGFGDFGWGFDENLQNSSMPTWTLEVSVKVHMKLKRGMRIGQVYFMTMEGDNSIRYGQRGRYNSQRDSQIAL